MACDTEMDKYDVTPDSGAQDLSNDVHCSACAYSAFGQSFTTPNDGKSYKICKARFKMQKVNNPTGKVQVWLYAHSGVYGNGQPAGSCSTPLAKSNVINGSDIPSAWTWIDFTFSGSQQYEMSPNTHYFICCCIYQAFNATHYVRVGRKNGGTHSGNFVGYNNGWVKATVYDCVFYVYGYIPASGGIMDGFICIE